MNYEVLLRETDALTYAEQINLMAYLAMSIQKKANNLENQKENKIKALDTLASLYTVEEMKIVDESIERGIKLEEVSL